MSTQPPPPPHQHGLPPQPYAAPRFDPAMVTTAFELPGHRIVRNFGIVRGIVVRSRNVFASFGAALQTLGGGDITIFTELCEKTRQDAFLRMIGHAAEHGANAIVGMRYDANELMQGVTEVLAYGTAVVVEPAYPTSVPQTGTNKEW